MRPARALDHGLDGPRTTSTGFESGLQIHPKRRGGRPVEIGKFVVALGQNHLCVAWPTGALGGANPSPEQDSPIAAPNRGGRTLAQRVSAG